MNYRSEPTQSSSNLTHTGICFKSEGVESSTVDAKISIGTVFGFQ